MKNALVKYGKSIINDEYYTPIYAITPLLRFLPKDLKIWECTDFGDSNITKVLRENGYNVVSSKKEEINFLTDKPNFDFDCIVTNPPYSLKNEFLQKCYEYGKPFALLLPITALEGKVRGGLFRQNGIEVMVFDKRINYLDNGKSAWFNSSWFCHGLLDERLKFEELERN